MDVSGYRHEESVVIDRPAQQLYDLVADVSQMGRWSPVCTGGTYDADGEWFTGWALVEADDFGARDRDTEAQVDGLGLIGRVENSHDKAGAILAWAEFGYRDSSGHVILWDRDFRETRCNYADLSPDDWTWINDGRWWRFRDGSEDAFRAQYRDRRTSYLRLQTPDGAWKNPTYSQLSDRDREWVDRQPPSRGFPEDSKR